MSLSFTSAVIRLNSGGVIIYPTETFFGIGCRADHAEAVSRIFRYKKRSFSMPLPVILGNLSQLPLVASPSPSICADIEKLFPFWPGPLTLLLPASAILPSLLTANTGKIAVRISSHPVAKALAESCGFPIVSTSANISGENAVTSSRALSSELLESMRPDADGVLDLPPAPPGGMASTIIEPKGSCTLAILRKGALSLEALEHAGFALLPSTSL